MSEVASIPMLVPLNFTTDLESKDNCNKLPIISSATIDSYIAHVNSIPMLNEEEEFTLAQRLQQYGDLQAAHRLVIAHLRYVVKIAKKYLGYGLPLADLIQEGTIGLMKAVSKFDLEKNVRLVTFALHWIKSEIHEYILKNWRIVKIATTKAQRKLFFKLRSIKKSINWLSHQEIKQIAMDLKVKPSDVQQMEQRIFGKDSCFDEPEPALIEGVEVSNDKTIVPKDYLEDFSFNPEAVLEKTEWEKVAFSKLHNAILKLDLRSQNILRRRWLQVEEKATLQDLAEEYGVSKERIRQLENQAILELRKYIDN